MTLARRLLVAGGGASFAGIPVPTSIVGMFNAAETSSYIYKIGSVTSEDAGATWTPSAAALLSATGSGWEQTYVKDPMLVWDGSQYVMFYTGWGGEHFRIGRATASSVAGPWTRDAGNPVLDVGASGFDANGVAFACVIYEAAESPAWKMWYTGYPEGGSGITGVTIGFADSTDGIAWTKRGQVVPLGAAGQYDDYACAVGAVMRVGSTYWIYISGTRSDEFFHTGTATCTDPTDPDDYTRQGVIDGLDAPITVGGWTWRSNGIRGIIPYGPQYLAALTVFNPGAAEGGAPTDTEEACVTILGDSPSEFAAPSGLMIPLGSSWYANSAENVSMI